MTEVRFSRVSKIYGSVKAVVDLSLSVNSGEFTTILGPSGSGKTTMLSLIAGIAAPTSGQIALGEREITHVPAAQRNIGLVFQSYALFPHMSIFDNVAFPLRVRKLPSQEVNERVAEALRLVRLTGFEKRRPHQLSGGQQQRVALARAVVFKPDILLLDEPLAALDRKLREEVRSEIKALQRSLGITTIMVTHDQEEAMSLSDRVVLLANGKVEQIGSPQEIYRRPRTRFAAGFLGLANFLEGRLDGKGAIVTEDGSFPCISAAASGTACGLVRPEDIRIDTEKGLLRGTVRDVVFLGEVARYSVESASGRMFIANLAGSRSHIAEGDVVWLSWDEDQVWLLPQGGSAKTIH
ncbi:MAG: ABC transporter ATP-binding protein [Rhizobiaceae bacterium]|nr:ABC transporter ATP-binding protein [Rhizobiaceae bacterium]